jgi:hypothetical protein
MLECEELEGVGCGLFLKSRSGSEGSLSKGRSFSKSDHALTGIAQNKRWSFAFPQATSSRSLTTLGTGEKSAGELVPG